MAMSKCKECNTKVSTLAKTCPKCGAPDPTAKETTTKKTTQKSSNNFVKVLATIGLVIAIGLILRGVFDVGKVGYKKVKKNITKEKIQEVRFTCEGQINEKYTDGMNFKDSDSGTFIDQYSMTLDDNGKPELIFLDESNNRAARKRVSGVGDSSLQVGQLTINISHNNYKWSDKIFVSSYSASISLQSGSYSGNVVSRYNSGDNKLLFGQSDLSGRCFGLEKYIESLK